MLDELQYAATPSVGTYSRNRARPSMVFLIKTVYANFSVSLFLRYCGGIYFERKNSFSAPRILFSVHSTQYFNEYFLL